MDERTNIGEKVRHIGNALEVELPNRINEELRYKYFENKMSKSKPDSAIFMTDSPEEVKRKISKAYCPEKQANENPILEYCKYIIFEKFKTFDIKRPEKFGGDVSFESYAELEKAYAEGKLHPMDVKAATTERINELLVPVRHHFETNEKAKELLETVNKLEVTR